jgi:hypothetical protein
LSVQKLIAFALLLLVSSCCAEPLADDVLLFARIREHVRAQMTQLLNCTCFQTSDRYRIQGARSARKHRIESSERLTLEIAYIGGKEVFAWPGAGSFESRSVSEIVAGGLTDTGGFSLFARSIFVDNIAIVKFSGKEDFEGRDAVHYDYSVAPLLSGYVVKSPAGSAAVGYSGSFWTDSKSYDLLRLTIRADNIPVSLNLARVVTVIDYSEAQINGSDRMLPQSVRTSMMRSSGDVIENLTDFTHCRRFIADSAISFDTLPEQPHQPVQKLETVVLPPDVLLAARLVQPIDSKTVRVGDAISARVEVKVTAKHRTLLPIGAVLNGRIRRVEKFVSPGPSVLLALEFTDFSFENSRGLLFADFQRSSAGIPAQATFPLASVSSYRIYLLRLGHEDSTSIEEFTNRELPGVATFYCAGTTCRLPAGTEMIWKTRPFTTHPAP